MNHAIKVSHDVYIRLQRLQRPRESYSKVIERTLNAYETIQGIRDGLPAAHYLQQRPKEEVSQ